MAFDTTPPWRRTQEAPAGDASRVDRSGASRVGDRTPCPPLEGAREVDVAIVGAGITGLTTAHVLASAGFKVALVEGRRIGDGETGHTTAHLTEIVDTRYHVLRDRFGSDGARLVALGQRLAIDSIRLLAKQTGVSADLAEVPGYLYAETDQQREELRREADACRELDVPVTWLDECPVPFATKGALRLEHQAQLDPQPYLAALARSFQSEGGLLFEDSPVTAVEDGSPAKVLTARGQILARDVVVTTHVPFTSRVFLQTKVAAYRTYALAAPLRAGQALQGLFWDCQTPYHYTRSHVIEGRPHLIVGGEDHRVGDVDGEEPAAFARLETYLHEHFLSWTDEPTYRWSGQILEPVDGLPFVGRDAAAKHVFVATGYSGNGITWGTLAGFVLADGVRGIDNPWEDLLEATRIKPFAGAKSFLSENVIFPKHLLLDRLKSAKREQDLAALPAGSGDVFKLKGERMAVYRGDDGTLSACSAVCPHLGCLVRWNPSERSWDCPCHGSRFAPDGAVLNGPSSAPLPKRGL